MLVFYSDVQRNRGFLNGLGYECGLADWPEDYEIRERMVRGLADGFVNENDPEMYTYLLQAPIKISDAIKTFATGEGAGNYDLMWSAFLYGWELGQEDWTEDTSVWD